MKLFRKCAISMRDINFSLIVLLDVTKYTATIRSPFVGITWHNALSYGAKIYCYCYCLCLHI